jgi:hypothetical protein
MLWPAANHCGRRRCWQAASGGSGDSVWSGRLKDGRRVADNWNKARSGHETEKTRLLMLLKIATDQKNCNRYFQQFFAERSNAAFLG